MSIVSIQKGLTRYSYRRLDIVAHPIRSIVTQSSDGVKKPLNKKYISIGSVNFHVIVFLQLIRQRYVSI